MSRKFIRIGTSIQIGDDLSGCTFQLNLNSAGTSTTSEYLVPQTICWDSATGTITYTTTNYHELKLIKTADQIDIQIRTSQTGGSYIHLYTFTDGGTISYDNNYTIPSDFGVINDITVDSEQDLVAYFCRYPFFKFEKNTSLVSKHIYDLVYRIYNLIALLRVYRMTIYQLFQAGYSIGGCTFTPKSGFTIYKNDGVPITPSVTVYGHALFFYYDCTKSSNFTAGNITNTQFVTIRIPLKKKCGVAHPFYQIEAFWARPFLNAGGGSLKSLSVSGWTVDGDYATFDVQVNAVQTADNRANCNSWARVRYRDIMR